METLKVIYYFLLVSLTFATTGQSEITTAICNRKGKFNRSDINSYNKGPAEQMGTVGICPQLLLSSITSVPKKNVPRALVYYYCDWYRLFGNERE